MNGKCAKLTLTLFGGAIFTLTIGVRAEDSGPESAPPTATEPAQPSAEDVLKEVLEQRRERPAIEPMEEPSAPTDPAGAPTRGTRIDVDERFVGMAPGRTQPTFRHEGEFISARRGRVIRSPGSSGTAAISGGAGGNQYLFVFEADEHHPAEPPMYLLSCKALESMEQYILERGDKVIFNVAGQIFTYRGAFYLLPRIEGGPETVAASETPEVVVTEPVHAEHESVEPVTDEMQPAAEDVLHDILEQRRERSETPPAEHSEESTSPVVIDQRITGIAPGQPQPVLRREGEFIPERRGRLVRSPGGNQFLFAFEADDRQAPEAPMVLLPCKALEDMEKYVIERGDKAVFSIAGQVFTYRGANYLLPALWKIPPDRGNLLN